MSQQIQKSIKNCKTIFDKLESKFQDILNNWLRPVPELVYTNFGFIYTVLLYTDKNILFALDDAILKLLFCTFPNKEFLLHVIQTFTNKQFSGKLSNAEIIRNFITEIQKNCVTSNLFIQDIFTPDAVFKKFYHEKILFIDIFTTSFYYWLNCTFPTEAIPLKKNHLNPHIKFPLDIAPIEWQRPTIIVDMANEFYDIGNYSQRVNYLFHHIDEILTKLFDKHDDPRLMVIFVNQADLNSQTNCPEIYDFTSKTNQYLIDGTLAQPLNRVALYLTVPCNVFQYPKLNVPEYTQVYNPYYFNHGTEPFKTRYDGKILGTEPLYTNGRPYNTQSKSRGFKPYLTIQDMKSVVYDEYGRMKKVIPRNPYYNNIKNTRPKSLQFLDKNGKVRRQQVKIPTFNPYIDVTSIDNFKSKNPTTKKANRPHRNAPMTSKPMIQGQNIYQGYVEKDSACAGDKNSGKLGKNEVDDYMIAILLLCHYKSRKECEYYTPFNYQWILFSKDGYSWMNRDLLTDVIHQKGFLQYINDDKIQPIPMMVPNLKTITIIKKCGLFENEPNAEQAQHYKQLHQGIFWMNRQHVPV